MGPLIVVNDISISRHFYEQLLEQKVQYDFGPNVSFEGNLAIHLRSHFQELLGEESQYPITLKTHNGELYFEADALEPIFERLRQAGAEFISEIQEQPWGQLAMRLYDPDGHILEIGESMEETVRRFYRQGWTAARIQEKTGMPHEFVEQAIQASGG